MSLGMFSPRETFCLMGTFCPIDVCVQGMFHTQDFPFKWSFVNGTFVTVGRFVLRDILYAHNTVQYKRGLAVGRFVLRDIVYTV